MQNEWWCQQALIRWFQREQENKHCQPLLVPPPPPLNAVKYSHWKHFPEHSPKKRWEGIWEYEI